MKLPSGEHDSIASILVVGEQLLGHLVDQQRARRKFAVLRVECRLPCIGGVAAIEQYLRGEARAFKARSMAA
jgi:hypothetical protein